MVFISAFIYACQTRFSGIFALAASRLQPRGQAPRTYFIYRNFLVESTNTYEHSNLDDDITPIQISSLLPLWTFFSQEVAHFLRDCIALAEDNNGFSGKSSRTRDEQMLSMWGRA